MLPTEKAKAIAAESAKHLLDRTYACPRGCDTTEVNKLHIDLATALHLCEAKAEAITAIQALVIEMVHGPVTEQALTPPGLEPKTSPEQSEFLSKITASADFTREALAAVRADALGDGRSA